MTVIRAPVCADLVSSSSASRAVSGRAFAGLLRTLQVSRICRKRHATRRRVDWGWGVEAEMATIGSP
jgi:hypothetical protein